MRYVQTGAEANAKAKAKAAEVLAPGRHTH
jgi:hypothetical protein